MPTLAPPIPSNLQVQQANNQVLVTVDLVPGATNYVFQRSTDGVAFSTVATQASPSYLDTTVTQGTKYWFQVASTNGTQSSFTIPQSVVPAQSGLLSLSQLRLMSQQRADRVNSQFVTDPEWNTYINQSLTELYDILTTTYEDYYTTIPVLFATTNAQQYNLPDGIATFKDMNGNTITPPPFYKLLGVDCGLAQNNNAWISLHKFDFISRNRYIFPNLTSTFLGVFNLRYRLYGNTLFFIPTPAAGQFIRIWYIPRVRNLLADNDLCDGVSGWTEYIIVDAAIKALQKEESDTSVLMAQKQMLLDRIQSSAMNRDAGQPDTISDTRSWGERYGSYGTPGGDGSFGGF